MVNLALAKLLVLTARPRLNAEQEARAQALCARDIDWLQFIQLAECKHSLPLAYRNLAALGTAGLPESFREEMRRRALSMTLAALRMASAQIQFQKTCLDACSADYAYIKGSAIAAAYYGNIGLRYARDIDILVRETMIPDVVFLALALGYTIELKGKSTNHCSKNDIASAVRQADVVTLRSPDGVYIELHKCLGKDGFTYFDTNRILQNKSVIYIDGRNLNMLNINDLFPYICYHHTAHYWSRLHWLADLDAIAGHPSFNAHRILTLAKRYRLYETVEACLALNRLTSDVDGWCSDALPVKGGQLLRACIKNLDGDNNTELIMRRSIYFGGFAFKWQRSSLTFWHIFTQKTVHLITAPKLSNELDDNSIWKKRTIVVSRVAKYIIRALLRKDNI